MEENNVQEKKEIEITDDYEMEIEKFKKIIDNRKELKKYSKALLEKGLGFSFIILSKVKNKKDRYDEEGLKQIYKKAGERGDLVLVYDCAKLLGKKYLEKAREFAVKEAKLDKNKVELVMKMFLANEDEEGIKMLGS